jgi:hypothetical protein
MVPVGFVPIYDHFRKIVAIAPEGVGVQVAFPPTGRLDYRRLGGGQ